MGHEWLIVIGSIRQLIKLQDVQKKVKFCAFLSRMYLIKVLPIADVQKRFEKFRTRSSDMKEHFFEKQGRTVTKGDVMFVKTRKILNKKHVTLLNKHGFYLTN